MNTFTKKKFMAVLVSAILLLTSSIASAQFPFNIGGFGAGNGKAAGQSIARDASNNVYVTGGFQGTVNFTGAGGTHFGLTSVGTQDIYVAKYNSAGVAQWAFDIGGSGALDDAMGIAADASGNVYITGWFQATTNFNPAGGGSLTVGPVVSGDGGQDIFVAKYNTSGVYQWAFEVDCPGGGEANGSVTCQVQGNGIAVDKAGNVLVIGEFTDTANFCGTSAGPNNLKNTSAFGTNAFVAKYSPAGAYIWAFSLAIAPQHSDGYGIATDASNNVYITGNFNKTEDFGGTSGSNPLTVVGGSGTDVYVAKYNSAGVNQWAFDIGTPGGGGTFDSYNVNQYGSYYAAGIATDPSGNVLVTGAFSGTSIDFKGTSGTSTLLNANSGQDAFVAKYNGTNGNNIWAFNIGTTNGIPADSFSNAGSGIATDASGNVYVTGSLQGQANFSGTAVGPNNVTSNGAVDVFVAKYNSSGAYQWAFSTGPIPGTAGNTVDVGNGIAVDANSNALVTGSFVGTSNFKGTSAGPDNITSFGGTETFFSSYNSSGAYNWAFNLPTAGSGVNSVKAIARDASNNVYVTGEFTGVDYFGGPGVDPLAASGFQDIFIAKYNAAGVYQWALDIGSGGNNICIGNGIAIDGSGNVLVTGSFAGTANFGGGNVTATGTTDIFVAQYNSSGAYQWAFNYGSSAKSCSGNAIATDGAPNNNVYVTGLFRGTVNFGGGSVTALGTSNNNIFIAKLTSAGAYGGWGFGIGFATAGRACAGTSIATDAAGNVNVGGTFEGTNVNFNPNGTAVNLTNSKGSSVFGFIPGAAGFVAQYSTAAGTCNWAFTVGRTTGSVTTNDVVNGIAVDASNNVLVTGSIGSATIAGNNFDGQAITRHGTQDILVGQCSSTGAYNWEFTIGSASQTNAGNAIAVDAGKNAYITGSFASTQSFNPLGGANLTSAGGNDIFVAEYNSLGAYQCAFKLGGAGADAGNAIATDGCSSALVAGTFSNVDNFNPGAIGTAILTPYTTDIFLAKYNVASTACPPNTWQATAAPVATAATVVAGTSFTANWNVEPSAIGYFLDVALDNAFSNLVAGYSNLSVVGNSLSVTGLINGTPYFYRVREANGSCTSANSNTVSVITTGCPPLNEGTATPAFSIICSGGTQLLNGGTTGTNLQWQISSDDINWTSIIGATNNTYTTASGDGSTNKYYRMMVKSATCWNVTSSTAEVDVSNPVIAVTTTNITDQTISLNWTPVGSGNYSVSWSGASSGSSTNTTPPKTITGLNPGGNYSITVTQTGLSLSGCPASGTVASTTTLCSAPTGLTATTPSNNQMNISWTGGAGNYRVFYRPLYTANSYFTQDVTAATAATITRLGNNVLPASTTFEVYVTTKDCPTVGAIGQPSPKIYVTTPPTLPCSAPVIDSVKSTCPIQIEVWMHPGSSPSGIYQIYFQRLTPTIQGVVSYQVTGNYYTVNIGSAGQTYLITAASNCGAGSYSNQVIWPGNLTVKPLCNSINNLVLSQPTCHGFTASWNIDQCLSNNVSYYQIYLRQQGNVNWNSYPVQPVPVAPMSPNKIVNWLGKGTIYQVYVRSIYSCNGYNTAGPASLILTDTTLSAGCRDEDEVTPDQPSVQQYSQDKNEVLSIYPNPNNGEFMLDISRLSNNEDKVRVEVFNMLGQTIMTDLTSISGGNMSEFIRVPSTATSGYYIVRVTVGNNVYTSKVNISR